MQLALEATVVVGQGVERELLHQVVQADRHTRRPVEVVGSTDESISNTE